MNANTIVSAGLSALVLALSLAGLPGAALADSDGDDDGYHRVHRYERRHEHHHHHWHPGPPPYVRKRVEHHHYCYDRPYYRDDYVRREYYYPRYRDNEFTIIYRGGW